MIELFIQHGSNLYYPAIEGDITIDYERKGSPAKLTFTVVKDDVIDFSEGDAVSLKIDERNVFFGFVFVKNRDKKKLIKVTAYDQLRYFKNKDTYFYENKTASELVKMVANDFNLKVGEIDDTEYKIPVRIEDNQTLYDIVYNALDLTLDNKKKLYVLYDDYGKLCLKDINNMKLNILICDETAKDYDYQSSIDGSTYNRIKIVRENEETGKREVYISQSSENMNKWGTLQYFDKIDSKSNIDPKAKADALLGLYNVVGRSLSIKGCLGDIRVRGGSSVLVDLDLGDLHVKNFMVVENAKHTVSNDKHLMDLKLIGGAFIE